MKNRHYLSLVVVALSCLAAWTVHAQLQRSSPVRPTWEYKSIVLTRGIDNAAWTGRFEDGKAIPGPFEAILKSKELGDQGWELVSVTPISSYAHAGYKDIKPSGYTTPSWAGYTDGLVYWFKRPR
jgi:hypothetical protein